MRAAASPSSRGRCSRCATASSCATPICSPPPTINSGATRPVISRHERDQEGQREGIRRDAANAYPGKESSMIRIAASLLAAAAALALSAGAASAAPQILGIVASNGALPLVCDDQGCRVELSTFCLQQPRANPEVGQQYTLADAASVTLIGRNAAGETLRLPAGPYLSFVSDR